MLVELAAVGVCHTDLAVQNGDLPTNFPVVLGSVVVTTALYVVANFLADIAIAPFTYNLLNSGLTWQPRPLLQRWVEQLAERPAYRKIVMIPVT